MLSKNISEEDASLIAQAKAIDRYHQVMEVESEIEGLKNQLEALETSAKASGGTKDDQAKIEALRGQIADKERTTA